MTRRLDPMPFLDAGFPVRRFVFKETTASTNADAENEPSGTVVAADCQTAGRGRLDHSWQSPPGVNLYFSVVVDCAGISPAEISTFPLAAGLAVCDALRLLLPPQSAPGLKWPNDILVCGRKLCGILCSLRGERIVAGIGVNVNQTEFPPEIASRATSLKLLSGRADGFFDRSAVLAALLRSLEARRMQWARSGFRSLLPEIAELDLLKGREVSVLRTDSDCSPARGVCGGIASDGSLLVGGERVYAGEAHVSLPPGAAVRSPGT